MTIREYIQENYDKIKSVLLKQYKKLSNGSFDEDLFHDTIMKVMYTLDGLEVDEDIINYIITAFKTNKFRTDKYAYNSKRMEIEDLNNINTSLDEICDNIDTLVVVNDIRKNFGKDLTKLFILWCKGYTINELLNHFGVYNLYYKFGCIKKFIKLNYDEVIKGV